MTGEPGILWWSLSSLLIGREPIWEISLRNVLFCLIGTDFCVLNLMVPGTHRNPNQKPCFRLVKNLMLSSDCGLDRIPLTVGERCICSVLTECPPDVRCPTYFVTGYAFPQVWFTRHPRNQHPNLLAGTDYQLTETPPFLVRNSRTWQILISPNSTLSCHFKVTWKSWHELRS